MDTNPKKPLKRSHKEAIDKIDEENLEESGEGAEPEEDEEDGAVIELRTFHSGDTLDAENITDKRLYLAKGYIEPGEIGLATYAEFGLFSDKLSRV